MVWSCLGRIGFTVYGNASADVRVLSSSGRPVSDMLRGDECSVRQLWMVSEPAGPVRYTVFARSSFATSSSLRHPVHWPRPSYCESIGSSSWLRGSTPSGPLSMPQSYR